MEATISSNPSIKYQIHPHISNPIFSKPNFFPSSPLSHPTFPKPASNAIVCKSSKTPSPRPPPPYLSEPPSNPSLSDQLKPLSLTLLPGSRQAPSPPHPLRSKPKSTWSNPTRPKPSVLSLHRHRREAVSTNPDLQELRLFSRRLNACDPSESAFSDTLSDLPHPPTRENALLILNSLRHWQKVHLFFRWLKEQNHFPLDTIFYNVVMKSLRQGKQYQLVEELALEMIDQGVDLDNVTYSTIITCAKRCGVHDKALEWFERMYKTGVLPDEVTYSAILDVYARMGKVGEVVSLYERARASGWQPDPVAFSVMAKMFGEAGDYDGIQYVLQEMRGLGVAPNLVVYNTLLEAMGKVGKPSPAQKLFDEMLQTGLVPNVKTLTAMVKIYGKARWGRDALELWEQIRKKKWPVDFILYNTLLSMCADLGLEEEAPKLFDEMRSSDSCQPDSWSYTSMINVYASGGKAHEAMLLYDEMMQEGIELNVMGCTCLIQCLGRARRINEAAKVFWGAMESGVKPDDRLCCCLLSVLTYCDGDDEEGQVLRCLEKANPALVELLKVLEKKEETLDMVKMSFRGVLNNVGVDVRRPLCNCLIDVCRGRELHERAHELLYLGAFYNLYPGLHNRSDREWMLDVRSLSVGAAQTALQDWTRTLSRAVENEEALPPLFSVHAGSGAHRFSQGLANSIAMQLEMLAAPMRSNEKRPGCFVSTREEMISWIQSRDAAVAAATAPA